MKIQFTLNNQEVSVEITEDITLLTMLRDFLGLTGTKQGCEIGECGSCSVILNDKLVNSCLILAAQVDGQEVVTIEGIRGEDGGLNDLQKNFIDSGAIQCGYCTPGMVLAGAVLLADHPAPNREQIREGLSGNLCRCTGYKQIFEAIEMTAKARNHFNKEQVGL
jgi:carbon-monoxide dehydrogenase small subunit